MSLTDELAFVLLAIRDADDETRYGLILKALALANMCGYEAGVRWDTKELEWPMATIELPTGQVGWTIQQHPHKWDGRTTEEKYRRIEAFAESAVRKNALRQLGEISEELGLYDE